jgi:tetratricopeptide (TPR) repeat protein
MELIITEIEKKQTICLNMIVKNESKIITRLFDSVLSLIDCYCICDTGSTDNTVELIKTYFNERNIPGRIVYEPFKNFCHNRTIAIKSCVGMSDYILLLDADMILVNNNNFDKSKLNLDYYFILQGSDAFYYKNVRIVKNNGLFSYTGVTHEHLVTPANSISANIEKNELFINDIGDGGAKGDKFERDIKLLTQGIIDEPNNCRYYFYLANSYKDNGKYNEAIEFYKKRITLGGWDQELWQSNYKIGQSFQALGNMAEAIFYWLEAYQIIPERIENIYQIIKYYRVIGKQKLALEFYNIAKKVIDRKLNKDDYLFLENDIYTYKCAYEYFIVAYYSQIKNINDELITIFNKCSDESLFRNVLSNMKFYTFVLKQEKTHDFSFYLNHTLNNIDYHFNSSSSCIIPNKEKDGYLFNVRLVNYKVNETGGYGGCEKHIISMYKYFELDKEFNILYEKLINENYVDRLYIGIEDVRIFNANLNSLDNKNNIKFIGTGYHENNKLGMVHGVYDIKNKNKLQGTEIFPLFNTTSDCEKNWVYFNYNGELRIVYNWFPLKICKINEDINTIIELIEEKSMPNLFKYARGSTCGAEYNNELWFVIHIVSYETPRHYYHVIVVFDKNMNLLRYSAPFKFEDICIEYCLGLIVEDSRVIMSYSTMDRTTKIATYNKSYIDSILVY